ncbi:MAG: c-type cytochrome, partial [Gemmobacter sp.]
RRSRHGTPQPVTQEVPAMHRPLAPLALAALIAATAQIATAPIATAAGGDEFERGKEEYLAACASCHGEAADGKGPIASMFRTPVPALTDLAARNDGVFPFLDVMHVIDGRTAVRAQGNPMPIFGRRYTTEIGEHAGLFGAEILVRSRVLELVSYLQSIQTPAPAGN